LNILVNNAGIKEIPDIENKSLADWHKIMEVNSTGVYLGTKLAILSMKENGELCSIINRSSGAGQIGDKNMLAYCAQKELSHFQLNLLPFHARIKAIA